MKTVLLVDDDIQVRTMFGLALRRAGYHVLEADSGVHGLEMARQYLPDVVLTDIHMPGGNGSNLLRDIRQDPSLQGTQVVLMTGRPDLVTPRTGMEEGADDFLIKPVSLTALTNCVKARISRSSISWRVEDQTVDKLRSLVPSNLPHEFFTPLTGILGLVEILRSDEVLLAPEEVKDIYGDIYFSAHRLHRALRNFLLVLDLESEPLENVPELSPAEVVKAIGNGIEEALRLNQRRNDITPRLEACSIKIKPGDLSHIVDELLDNACKFSRVGTPIEIHLDTTGKLSVTDRGRGMGEDDIKRIGAFQQFERKKYEQQGLGLGLTLLLKLTMLYEAQFNITSQLGEGTRVEIQFPLVKTA
jgi:signal transduction histidine kinase